MRERSDVMSSGTRLARDKNKKKPKRYKQYRLRMSDAEDARLKRLSEETGMSCADVMRDALDKYRGMTRET